MILLDDEMQALKAAASTANVDEYWIAKNNIMRRLHGNEKVQKDVEAEIASSIPDWVKVDGASLVNAIKDGRTDQRARDKMLWLVQHGANVCAQDQKGNIPLIAALNIVNRDQRIYVCKLLTQYGANWDQKPNLNLILSHEDKARAFKISPRQFATAVEDDVRKTHNIEPYQPQARDPFGWLRPYIADIQNENYLTDQYIVTGMNYLQDKYSDAHCSEHEEALKLYTLLLNEQNRRQAQQVLQRWNPQGQPYQQQQAMPAPQCGPGGPMRETWLLWHKDYMNAPGRLSDFILSYAINFLEQEFIEGRFPYDGAAQELGVLYAERNKRQIPSVVLPPAVSLSLQPPPVVLPPAASPSPEPLVGYPALPAAPPVRANLSGQEEIKQIIALRKDIVFLPYKKAHEDAQVAKGNKEEQKEEQKEDQKEELNAAGYFSWLRPW
jgi:hypothetical protein